ncbi:hypothetical protein SAMN05216345_107359 [Cupriavidus sp. YR651]|uniref:hypothetical protein n=1 Tax=Cupriavidus sp. YR651 TaxID=1855315 RepID=UPI0008849A56|nr:hypothetical protein [Cupriavidus sp. YR651]SDD30431.1 hypothetical protein SAMN05216345_107359 [Cupriavidus sp. YR651]
MQNTDRLEVFQHLLISVSEGEKELLREQLALPRQGIWELDHAEGSRVHSWAGAPQPIRYMSDEATLWLMDIGPNLQVSNIVPRKRSQFDKGTYNALLQSFVEEVARPALRGTSATLELTEPYISIYDCLSKDAAEKLGQFSFAANKSTGASHPMDKARWLSFLIAAHNDVERELTTEFLERWLVEAWDWPETVASELALEYDFAGDLLQAYDKAKQK